MLVLVLDDQDIRHEVIGTMLKKLGHQAVHVRDYHEAVKALKAAVFDTMFLDHDLEHYVDSQTGERVQPVFYNGIELPPKGCKELTGLDVVHQIIAMPSANHPEQVTIHSWNPDGALRMKRALQSNGIRVIGCVDAQPPAKRTMHLSRVSGSTPVLTANFGAR